MASITPHGNKFRANVCVNYKRKSKILDTLEDARRWAELEEARARVKETSRLNDSESVLLSRLPIRMLKAIEGIKYSHGEICTNYIPYGVESGIYFLIRDLEVIYVGQSVNVLERIARHRREGKWFDGFNYLPCPKEQMDELETAYITAFSPKYNAMVGPSKRRARFSQADAQAAQASVRC